MGTANVELYSSPDSIILLDNGINYVANSNRVWTAATASLHVSFPNDQTAYSGKFFEITIGEDVYKFYFVSNPDLSGLELNYWDIALSYAEFLIQVAEDLNKFYPLISKYAILPYANGIEFTSRLSGYEFSLSLSDFDVINMDVDSNISGSDSDMPADYKIYFAPVLSSGGIHGNSIGEDLSPIDENNHATTNLQEYLKYILKSSFVYPSNAVLVREVPDACIKMFIRYGEFEDNQVKLLYNTFDTDLYVLNGGLSQLDKEFLALKDYDFFGYDDRPTKFLTWAPNPKVTFADAPERLYFLKTQTSDIKLWKKKTTSSGDTITLVETISISDHTVIEIASGLSELFPDDPDTILSYEVWLSDTNDIAISETRLFIVDNSDYQNKRSIFFKNSLGMYETICCTGDLSVSDNIKREEFQVFRNGVFKRSYSLTENIPQYKLSSGWLQSLEARQWLNDLLLSKDCFLTIGDMVLPIQITTGKVLNHNSRDNLYSLLFSFEPDFSDSRYSTIAIPEGNDFVLVDENWNILMDENGFTLLDDI